MRATRANAAEDAELDEQAATRILARHGISACAPVVVTVASTLPWKGHTAFLHAAALVHRQVPEAHFVVLGGPSNLALLGRLEEAVLDLRLTGHFHFVPAAGDGESLLRFSQALCLLSEAFPDTVLQAMSAGLPIVALNTANMRSLLEHAVTGFLVEPGDTIEAADRIRDLLLSPELRDQMGAAAARCMHPQASARRKLAQTS